MKRVILRNFYSVRSFLSLFFFFSLFRSFFVALKKKRFSSSPFAYQRLSPKFAPNSKENSKEGKKLTKTNTLRVERLLELYNKPKKRKKRFEEFESPTRRRAPTRKVRERNSWRKGRMSGWRESFFSGESRESIIQSKKPGRRINSCVHVHARWIYPHFPR